MPQCFIIVGGGTHATTRLVSMLYYCVHGVCAHTRVWRKGQSVEWFSPLTILILHFILLFFCVALAVLEFTM